MDSLTISTIVICVIAALLSVIWCIFSYIRFFAKDWKSFGSKSKIKADLSCSVCNEDFEEDIYTIIKPAKTRYTKINNKYIAKRGFLKEAAYSSYEKMIYCPYCKKVNWVQIQNINEINKDDDLYKEVYSQVAGKLVKILIGFALIIILVLIIPISIVNGVM